MLTDQLLSLAPTALAPPTVDDPARDINRADPLDGAAPSPSPDDP